MGPGDGLTPLVICGSLPTSLDDCFPTIVSKSKISTLPAPSLLLDACTLLSPNSLLLNPFQSGFCLPHSVKIALVELTNDFHFVQLSEQLLDLVLL